MSQLPGEILEMILDYLSTDREFPLLRRTCKDWDSAIKHLMCVYSGAAFSRLKSDFILGIGKFLQLVNIPMMYYAYGSLSLHFQYDVPVFNMRKIPEIKMIMWGDKIKLFYHRKGLCLTREGIREIGYYHRFSYGRYPFYIRLEKGIKKISDSTQFGQWGEFEKEKHLRRWIKSYEQPMSDYLEVQEDKPNIGVERRPYGITYYDWEDLQINKYGDEISIHPGLLYKQYIRVSIDFDTPNFKKWKRRLEDPFKWVFGDSPFYKCS